MAEAVAVSVVAGSTGEALPVAVSTVGVLVVDSAGETSAAVVSVGDVSAVAVSTALAFAVAVLVGATGVATVIRGGGTGAIRTDITVTTITRTVTIDTVDTRTMDTAAPVMDTAMAADQGISGVSEGGDKPDYSF